MKKKYISIFKNILKFSDLFGFFPFNFCFNIANLYLLKEISFKIK